MQYTIYILIILSVQLGSIKYFHIIVQQSATSIIPNWSSVIIKQ